MNKQSIKELVTSKQPTRLPGLDGLRAISAVMVVARHIGQSRENWGSQSVGAILETGAFGVQIFFVLSGFLITYLLLQEERREGRVNLRHFYFRRTLRILPPAYCYLIFLLLLLLAGVISFELKQIIPAFLFYSNLVKRPVYADHYWTLAIEEQFYLLWPAAFLLLGPRKRLWAAVLTCAALPFYRKLNSLLLGDVNWTRADLQCDALLIGVIIAHIWISPSIREAIRPVARRIDILFPAFTVLIGISFYIARPAFFLGPFRLWLVAAVILLVVFGEASRTNQALNSSPFVWTGKISYSLYLWQQLTSFYPFGTGWASVLIAVCLAFIFGALSYYLVEQPALRLRARLERKRVMEPTPQLVTD